MNNLHLDTFVNDLESAGTSAGDSDLADLDTGIGAGILWIALARFVRRILHSKGICECAPGW